MRYLLSLILLCSVAHASDTFSRVPRAISDDPDPAPVSYRTTRLVSPAFDPLTATVIHTRDLGIVESGEIAIALYKLSRPVWPAAEPLPDVIVWRVPSPNPWGTCDTKAECEAHVEESCGLVGSSRDTSIDVTFEPVASGQDGSCSGTCANGVEVIATCGAAQ